MADEGKTLRNVFIGIMITGLIIFLIGVFVCVKFIFVDVINKESTYATVTNIYNNYTYVTYKANGRIYNKKYSVYNSSYYIGKKIKIYYNKQQPGKSFIAGMRYLTLIVPGIGIVFLAVSGIGFMIVYQKYYRI